MKNSRIFLLILLLNTQLKTVPPFPPHLPPGQQLPQSYEINPRQMFAQTSDHFEKNAQSFMFTRPVYRNFASEQTAWHDFIYEYCGSFGMSFQAIALYQHSLVLRNVARYFLINRKNTLIVKGDSVSDAALRDVRAEWVGLPDNFIGTMSLNPKQQQASLWLELNQDLSRLFPFDFFKSFWISLATPIHYIENDINLMQTVQQTAQGPGSNVVPHDIFQAFNQNSWKFGKMRLTSKKKIQIAEIIFKLGTIFMDRDGFQIGAYTSFIAPTAEVQKATYIFNPFIGHNRHFGFGTGVNFQFPLNSDLAHYLLAFFFNVENIFFIRNTQFRSVDLKNNQWSRYLLLNKDDGTVNIPAINVLTRKFKVQPFNMVDVSVGFRLQTEHLELETGYSVWAHGDEELKLHRLFPENYGIAGDGTLVPGTNIAATASNSTIKQRSANDLTLAGQPTFIPIQQSDLDFYSGCARAAVTHRFHLACNIMLFTKLYAGFLGAGVFFETPQENTALSNWGIWAKIGISL